MEKEINQPKPYCRFFNSGRCIKGNDCPFQHCYRQCAFFDPKDKTSCAKGVRCEFAHLEKREIFRLQRLGLLMRADERLHPCPNRGCSNFCLGRQCFRCHTNQKIRVKRRRRARASARTRARSRSVSPSVRPQRKRKCFRRTSKSEECNTRKEKGNKEEGEVSESERSETEPEPESPKPKVRPEAQAKVTKEESTFETDMREALSD